MPLRASGWLPVLIACCTPSWFFAFSLLCFSLHRHFPFAGINVFVIHGVLDSAAGSCDDLSNLVLFFMQFELCQELRKHGIDPIQGDIGFS